ncbi:hybrid sensor histidine kinase/response regulator [Stutzerimonas azotifigens]|uniref:hybrid sensor histidine kinase/response regulator n=1 Tax=Stutzerimonas azotifigens TaxID=291995 RepID=UPI00068677D1|nr:ATP-binding protein [Stutzerimonas azotifigens]
MVRAIRRLPDYRRWPIVLRCGLAVIFVLFAALLRMMMPVMGLPYLLFVPPLMVIGFMLGFGPGVLATFIITLVSAFAFVGEPYSFDLTREQWVATGLFLVVDLVIVAVCVALRQSLDQFQALARQLEQRVEERTRERDQIWQASPDLLCTRTLDGRFISLNPAWERLLGWTTADLRWRPFTDFVHPDDLERTREGFASLTVDSPALGFENRYRHRDGSYRWLSWNSALRDGKVYSTGRDITALKEQSDVLRQTEELLRHSQKMEAVGQLTGGLAHDFNNLLTGITGSLQLVQTRLAQGRGEDVDRYIQTALTAASRAASLTHRLLAFSRRQTLDPRPTRANELIEGMLDLIERTVGPQVALRTRLPEDVWIARCDPHQLESALLNLCINARDAMPDGGELTITATNLPLDESGARREGLRPGDYIAVAVTDTGTGMPPEVAARAFDPFFTTKPTGMGTGLGLSMIYGFAQQSGGKAQIHSVDGHGTTVRLLLPRHLGPIEADPEPAREEPSAASVSGHTVLVVDDEPLVRLLILEVLGELGYATLEAADGASGLEILQSDAPIDLMITDVGLPGGMNGRQLADAARQVRPALKVLYITGYAESTAIGEQDLGPDRHLMTKPFSMDALAARIEAIVLGREG